MGSTWLPNGLTRTDRSLRPTTTSRTVGCSARSPFRRPAFRWASPTPFHRLSIHFFGRGTGETTGFPPHASLAPSAIINHLFRTCGHGPSDYREIESTNGTKAVRLRINPSPGPDLLRAERGSCQACNSDGLSPGLLGHFSGATPFPPPIVHVHAVVFTGWLALFTAQIWMIRSRRVDIHRRTRSRCCCS